MLDKAEKVSLYDLCKLFPGTPKSIVLKGDVIVRGIKLSLVIINFKKEYHTNFFFLKDGTSILATYKKDSPYEIKISDAKIYLFYRNVIIEEIYFIPIPKYIKRAAKEKRLNSLFSQRSTSCVYLAPISACAYFKQKEQCSFCGFNFTWNKYLKGNAKLIPEPEYFVDLVNEGIEECNLTHVKLAGGAFYNLNKEIDVFCDLSEALRKKTKIPVIHAYPQAFDKEGSQRLHDSGIDGVCYDLEIWDEHLWNLMLPGKSKVIGRKEWLKRLIDAVCVFGEGQVSTNFVAGYDLAHPEGFKTEQDSLQSMVEGFNFLVENGIEPSFFPWSPESPDAAESNYDNFSEISTSYYLHLSEELHKIFIKNDFYAKMGYNKITGESSNQRLICHKCGYHSLSQDYPRLTADKTLQADKNGFYSEC